MFPIEFLRHTAVALPTHIAAVEGEHAISYRDLAEQAEALGVSLQTMTGKQRPTVSILGPNSISMLISLMAIHACGAIFVPLNGRNSKVELDSQIAFVRPDVIIVHKSYIDKLSPPAAHLIITDGESDDPRALQNAMAPHLGRRPHFEALLGDQNAIKFTGGSSGGPKGVRQSFRSMNTLVSSLLIAFAFQADDRFLCAAPMTHGAGSFLLPMLARGARIVMTADAAPDSLLDLIEKHEITTTFVPPTLLYKLIEIQRERPRNVASLRHLIWGAAPATPARLQEAQAVFGPVIEVIYGQTETPLIVAAGRAAELSGKRLESVGRVGPLAEVAIIDADGGLCAPGQDGEICTRGDLVMDGYVNLPDETAKTLRDGWLRTGDVGCLDEDGFLYIKDRLRDVIITGGFNVYPSDVEAALSAHAAVSDVAVYGVPDEYWGEKVEASVELRAGKEVTSNQLIAHCKQLLGSVKAPKEIHILGELPRSPVGKVLRRIAREWAIEAAKHSKH
jgi:acyl-CoA synthetase (AMP-forming)/AMP-acid ligase II